MNKLTTEQLLFAHRIGATYSGELTGFYKLEGTGWQFWNEGWLLSNATNDHTASITKRIDFTPLYDWIDHDGGECPVLPDDIVIIELSNSVGGSITVQASLFDWGARGIDGMLICKRFKLCRAEYWPEQRTDAIGQNGNTGEHYEEQPETTHATAHHKRQDGSDLIDDWWNDYQPEIARILMWEQVRKYKNRLGKKDSIHVEVSKMADYLRRWAEKEQELASKPED